jgi:phosphopantetheine adenylyltransferase
MALARESLAHLDNVEVTSFSGLLVTGRGRAACIR